MSGDNRSVATDALETLGSVLGDGVARDAIHLAVEPAIAGQFLRAGDHIGLRDGAAYTGDVKCLGIVDPFLKTTLSKGDKFWLVVYPRQITSLRHVWSHPDFADSVEVKAIKGASANPEEALIREMAEGMGLSYGALMEYGREHAEGWDDGYVVQQGHESWRDGFNAETFWPAYEAVTGVKVDEDKKDHFFSCSC